MPDIWEENKDKWLAMAAKHGKEKKLQDNLALAKKQIPGEGGTKYAKDVKPGKGKNPDIFSRLADAIKYMFGGSQIEINAGDLARMIQAKEDRELQQRDDNVNALEDTWEK